MKSCTFLTRLRERPALVLGFLLVVTYWIWVCPPSFSVLGNGEDLCSDFVRQMMSENLTQFGKPVFHTSGYMAPTGASVPYMSWSIERDWLGGWAWLWNRKFPFLWAYYGLSLVASYFGVGFILEKMRLGRNASWALAASVVLFHVPRHFKTYHHFEHLPQHWMYWSVFLDVWIWDRFRRERIWDVNLEFWRGVCLLGIFCSAGYFWPVMVLEWGLLRGGVLLGTAWRKRQGLGTAIQFLPKKAALPVTLILALLAIELRWFLPLAAEVGKQGPIGYQLSWFSDWTRLFEPLWLEKILALLYWIAPGLPRLTPIDASETVVTVGWFYWVPVSISLYATCKIERSKGVLALAPFLLLLLIGLFYITGGSIGTGIAEILRDLIPLFRFFRVASRWGLILPLILTALIVLCWPEVTAWAREKWQHGLQSAAPAKRKGFIVAAGVFAFLSVLEWTWLIYPINVMPPLTPSMEGLLEKIRVLPGDTVLDLPFCVAGGNGYCTLEQCPNYPSSVVGQCLRLWHDKKVFGLYQARMTPEHCQIYNRQPFNSWFGAWREQRCFTPPEWKDFCGYLDTQKELSAVLLYPEIWHASQKPECFQQFVNHLGQPLGKEAMMTSPSRDGLGRNPTHLLWFGAKCRSDLPIGP